MSETFYLTFKIMQEKYPLAYEELLKYLKEPYDVEGSTNVQISISEEEGGILEIDYEYDGDEDMDIWLQRDLYEFFDFYGIRISIFTINHGKEKGLFTFSIDDFEATNMSLAFKQRQEAEFWAFMDAARVLTLIIENKI